jgi:hypothetical protein
MLDFILLLISIPAFALACALWAVVGFESATRLGYRAPAAALVLLLGAGGGIVATVIRHPPNTVGFRSFVDLFWLTWLSAAAVTASILLVLPRRQVRTFGNRRPGFPFAKAGQVLIAAAMIFAAVVIASSLRGALGRRQLAGGLALAFGFLVPTGRYLVRLGRRADATASADQGAVEALDHPVLYLRAFNQEGQFFAIRSAAEYGTLPKGWHATVSRPDQNVGGTFEEYFADALARALGPLVALGSPEDYVAPEGAARLYAKDSDWMQHVGLLAQKASAIVVEVGASANLRWEFEHIRKEGLQQKLFVITRPSTEGKWLSWTFWRLVWRIQGIPNVPFRSFAASLAALGYDFGDVESGPGSVFAFDANGKAQLLTTHAVRPGEFVAPIRDWIADRRLSGRSVPVPCSRCGRRIHVYQADEHTPRTCRDCRYGAPWVRVWKRIAARVYVLGWFFLVMPATFAIGVFASKGSFVDRHSDWIVGATFIATGCALLFVLGHMDDPPPLGEPDGDGTETESADSRRPDDDRSTPDLGHERTAGRAARRGRRRSR